MAERRRELVAIRGEIDSVEPGSADEFPVEMGGVRGDRSQGRVDGRREQGGRPVDVSEHRTGYPERYGRLQRPGVRLVADRRTQPPKHGGENVVASRTCGAVRIAPRASPDG